VRATAAFEAALPRSVAGADDDGSKGAIGNGSKGAGTVAEDSDEDSGGEAVPTVKQFNTSRKVTSPLNRQCVRARSPGAHAHALRF